MEREEQKPKARPTQEIPRQTKKTLQDLQREYDTAHWTIRAQVDFKGYCKLSKDLNYV